MHDELSFHKRSGAPVSEALAVEMQEIARAAAKPLAAGDSIKTQMRRAWAALGRPTFWRLRAAWYGEAGCWAGAAIEEFRSRDAARRRKEEALRGQAADNRRRRAAIAQMVVSENEELHRRAAARLERRRVGTGDAGRPVADAGADR